MFVNDVPKAPVALFEPSAASIRRRTEDSSISLGEYVEKLRTEYAQLDQKAEEFVRSAGIDVMDDIAKIMAELQELSVRHERASASLTDTRLGLKEFEVLLAEADEDLARNKTAAKLRNLGAKQELATAKDHCPTCNQQVEDTLLAKAVTGPQMDLATNISYLQIQQRMLRRQTAGLISG